MSMKRTIGQILIVVMILTFVSIYFSCCDELFVSGSNINVAHNHYGHNSTGNAVVNGVKSDCPTMYKGNHCSYTLFGVKTITSPFANQLALLSVGVVLLIVFILTIEKKFCDKSYYCLLRQKFRYSFSLQNILYVRLFSSGIINPKIY